MVIEVYGEMIIFINWVVHGLLYFQLGKFTKTPLAIKRLVLISLLTAIASLAAFYIPKGKGIYVVSVFLGTAVVFTFDSIENVIKRWIILAILGLLLTGISMVVAKVITNFWLVFMVSLLVFYGVGNLILLVYQQLFSREKRIQPVVIFLHNRQVSIEALLDTGHFLMDPLSGQPVLICEYEKLKSLLPQSLQIFYHENTEDMTEIMYLRDIKKIQGRLIPYETITGKSLLLGFIPDKIEIDGRNVTGVVGIIKTQLSGEYGALISGEMLEKK